MEFNAQESEPSSRSHSSSTGWEPAPDRQRTAGEFIHEGIILSNGERWRQVRNFTLRNLRELGFGKKSFEEKIQEEVKNVVEELKKLKGKPLDVTELFMNAISNILFSMFGNRYEYNDETFMKVLAIMEQTFYLISCSWGQEKDNPSSEFNEWNLVAIIHNFFMAGTEAVSSMLRNALLINLYHPEVQEKLHSEVDGVIGRDRIPNIKDRPNMPYTEAVMHEVLRFGDLAPFSVPHMVTKDVEFKGYFLPKGTEVYPLLCTVHRDPTKFETPNKFNPNHFLDENGKFMKNDAMMAFSAGKRICPREQLAWMEAFLFLTMILQNFNLTSQTRLTEADITPKLAGFQNFPIHYELSFIPRYL
uniref:Cytochrome P450 n=1 Tax=Leptobrachium leishanense TaxID=445787 RepID=A0A8C5Q861_9ANUR